MASTYKMPVAPSTPPKMSPDVAKCLLGGVGGQNHSSLRTTGGKESLVITVSSRLMASDLFHFVDYLSVCALRPDHPFS